MTPDGASPSSLPVVARVGSAEVRSTFAGIAPRYDLANRLLSGGFDVLWRRRLAREVAGRGPQSVLDLATGSGDVAFALRKALAEETEVTGLDFCRPMLDEAERKRTAIGNLPNLRFVEGDCLDLPFGDAAFDAVTIAFGLRNLPDRGRGLAEMHRVLRLGGSLHVLEFSQPYACLCPFHYLYLHGILPWFAGLLTGDRAAYQYLGASIADFPDRVALSKELAEAGFSDVRVIPLTGSIVALHSALASQKP